MKRKNLFEAIPDDLPDEWVDVLAETANRGFRIERIVSRGQSSPPGFWYDQESLEWVVLLRGSATLSFEDPAETIGLEPGDWIEIPAHRRHRVENTSPADDTVWLAVHETGAAPAPDFGVASS